MSQVEVPSSSQHDNLTCQHGRTDGRTYEEPNCETAQRLVSDVRTRVQSDDDSWVTLSDVLEAGFLHTGQRFPVVRAGERADIAWHVRAAVYYRDKGTCQRCRAERPKPWHLDHIVPWSAGGSDRTENLRLLCEPCNVNRSNYDDGTVFAKRPATWWCHRCYGREHDWRYGDNLRESASYPDKAHVLCGKYAGHHTKCRVEGNYRAQRRKGLVPTWHERGPIEHAALIAYCAHCDVVGMTDVTL